MQQASQPLLYSGEVGERKNAGGVEEACYSILPRATLPLPLPSTYVLLTASVRSVFKGGRLEHV